MDNPAKRSRCLHSDKLKAMITSIEKKTQNYGSLILDVNLHWTIKNESSSFFFFGYP